MNTIVLSVLLTLSVIYLLFRLTALYFLGSSENLVHQGRLKESGKVFDILLRFFPGAVKHSYSLNQAVIDAGLVRSPFGPVQILNFYSEVCMKGEKRYPRDAFFPRALSGLWHQQGKNEEALLALQKAIALAPRNLTLRRSLGFFHEYTGSLPGALETYREALALQKKPRISLEGILSPRRKALDLASTHRSIAEVLTKLNRVEEAIEELKTSLVLDADSKDAGLTYTILSQNFERLDRMEEAEKILREGLESPFPDKASLHHYLGSLFARLKKFPEAEEEMHRAKDANPRLISAYMGMAEILEEEGKETESLAELHSALAVDPHNPWLYLSLGQFYERQGDLDKAVTHYHKVFPLLAESRSPEMEIIKSFVQLLAHRFLGGVYFHQNRNEEALKEFRQSLKVDAESHTTRLFMGDIYTRLGKVQEARKEFALGEEKLQELIAQNPGELQVVIGLGDLLQRTGREEEALEHYRQALETDPRSYNAWFGTGETREKLKDFEGAREAFGKAREFAPRKHLEKKVEDRLKEMEKARGGA